MDNFESVDDPDHIANWAKLKEIRRTMNALGEEKLQLVHKIFNEAQKFVQELDAQNNEL